MLIKYNVLKERLQIYLSQLAICIIITSMIIFRDAILVCLMDLMTGFAGGFVIFSVIGHVAHQTGLDIKNFSQSGIIMCDIKQ